MWSAPFGTGGTTTATSIALDLRDDVFLTGTSVPAESGARPTGTPFGGPLLAFVAKFTADGALAWNQEIGDVSSEAAPRLAVDASGGAFLLANYGVLAPGTTGQRLVVGPQVHLVKYDTNGNVLWSSVYSRPGGAIVADALAVDTAGYAYVAGRLGEELSFGQCTLAPAAGGVTAAFVGRVAPDGTAMCAAAYGSSGVTRIHAMSVRAAGNVVMAGDFTGGVDFGQGALQATGDTAFVAAEDETVGPLH
jgi:hypothetical protein